MLLALIGTCLSDPPNAHFLVWVGRALVPAASVYSLKFVRCPHCGKEISE